VVSIGEGVNASVLRMIHLEILQQSLDVLFLLLGEFNFLANELLAPLHRGALAQAVNNVLP
jgi:hypothetical protein